MPVYEYCCQACGHEFEREQRITEDPVKTCPQCKAAKAKRMISRTSFVLKGGGWYSDLYASSGGGKGEDSPSDGGGAAKADDSGSKKKPKKKGGAKGGGKSSKPSKGAKGSAAA